MGEIRTFRDDDVLKPFLDAISKRKRSRVIRRALYNYFFKGEDKVMVDEEDEKSYIKMIVKKEVVVEPVKEISFNMFED